jgi:hypothetical protein
MSTKIRFEGDEKFGELNPGDNYYFYYLHLFYLSLKQEHKNPEQITRSVAFAVAFWRGILWSVFAHSICSLGWENTADFCPYKEQRQALISFNVLLKIDGME